MMVKHLKSNSTQPNSETTRITLYIIRRILLEFDEIVGSVGDRLASARGRTSNSNGKIGERHDQHVFLPKAYGDIADAYGNRGCINSASSGLP